MVGVAGEICVYFVSLFRELSLLQLLMEVYLRIVAGASSSNDLSFSSAEAFLDNDRAWLRVIPESSNAVFWVPVQVSFVHYGFERVC